MQRVLKQRWALLAGLMVGYIAWDIVDQTILQPHGWAAGYLVDWSVIGAIGLTAWMVNEYHQRQQPAIVSDSPNTAGLVQAQATETLSELQHTLSTIQVALGDAFVEEGISQQRLLRQAIITLHESQSLADELRGLVAHHRPTLPTHEVYEQSTQLRRL